MSISNSTSPPLKTCSRCGHLLPADTRYFYKTTSAGTLRPDCIACTGAARRERERERRIKYANGETPIPAAKKCPSCGETKPATEFQRKRSGHDGLSFYCKTCQSEACRTRYRADPAIHYARSRKWVIKHRAKSNAGSARYKDGHREDVRACDRDRYRRNREAIRERKRQWRAAHPEAGRAEQQKRRALVAGASGDHSNDDILAQLGRQKRRCFYCHKPLDVYHVEHVVPLALGGSNGPENIVLACPSCNLKKGCQHPMDFCGILC